MEDYIFINNLALFASDLRVIIQKWVRNLQKRYVKVCAEDSRREINC